jgi:hypothetical protein
MTSAAHNASLTSDVARDARGIVYVEFVFAFMPLLVMFLSICQLAFLTMGRLVVQHAALCGARAAIVVLEDDPTKYADAPRGNLNDGDPSLGGLDAILESVGLGEVGSALRDAGATSVLDEKTDDRSAEQRGARMVSIRAATTMPLLLLAPNESAVAVGGTDSVAGSLPGDFINRLPFSLAYTSVASVVTVHTATNTEELAAENIDRTAPITVRVTYLMPCGMPLARMLMCQPLAKLLKAAADSPSARAATGAEESVFARRLRHAQGIGALKDLVSPSARFVVLTAQTTLPNQGAAYDHKGTP